MTLAELHPIWREALATYETFRRLGFTPDDIHLGKLNDGRVTLGIASVCFASVLIPAGDPKAAYAFKDHDDSTLVKNWQEACDLWNVGDEAELQEIYATSTIFRDKVAFMVSLQCAGIEIPCTVDA